MVGMYFPKDMTFQYFFFSTYPGYFLQVLPVALAAAGIWYALRRRGRRRAPVGRTLWGCAFVGYLTGLVCLVALLRVIQVLWYFLLYHRESGIRLFWFEGGFDLVPDFWNRLGDGETIGNLLLFLPFGVLYPLSHPGASWRRTMLAGWACVAAIELLQPIFGRAFDINNVILNALSVAASTLAFFLLRKALTKGKEPGGAG